MTLGTRIVSAVVTAIGISSVAADAHSAEQPLPSAGASAAAQEINTGPENACTLGVGTARARPCLQGAAGACLTQPAMRALRDGAAIKLPERSTQLGAAETRAEALQGALNATKLRADMLQAALDDTRVALASERARADKATEAAVARGSTSRWAQVALVAGGLVVGAGVTLGIAYALRPAVTGTGGAAAAALVSPRPGRAPLAPRVFGIGVRF